MNRRLPKRSEKKPASGETTIVAPVHTRSLTPACSGVFPSTFCRNWLRKKIEPNIPKYMASDTALVTAKPRRAKKLIGSIGASVRRSWTMKAIVSATPAASDDEHPVLVQPSDWLRISPNTIPNRPVEPSPSPGRSSWREGPWLSADAHGPAAPASGRSAR